MEQDNKQSPQRDAEYYRASAEVHRENIKSTWNIFLKTGVFTLAAVCALLILCIAWFVMNSRVNSSTTSISAQQDVIRIASKGDRQEAEKSNLKLDDGTKLVYQDKED